MDSSDFLPPPMKLAKIAYADFGVRQMWIKSQIKSLSLASYGFGEVTTSPRFSFLQCYKGD